MKKIKEKRIECLFQSRFTDDFGYFLYENAKKIYKK